ncbi:translation initiation factor IF-2-like [Microtus oregoni]|uniref:translation initiation factor IF-2-like n=1 Tax=Microtus oregoni TaxID=111838 RepID=UPI001BB1A472|nr:translation initiation factor IF-2-like [Microtus oregoni]
MAGGPGTPWPAEPRSRRARRLVVQRRLPRRRRQQKPAATAARGARREARGPAAQSGRPERGERTRSPGSAPPPPPARPHGGRGEGQGGAGSAGGKRGAPGRGGAGRGAAGGTIGAHRALLRSREGEACRPFQSMRCARERGEGAAGNAKLSPGSPKVLPPKPNDCQRVFRSALRDSLGARATKATGQRQSVELRREGQQSPCSQASGFHESPEGILAQEH